MAGALVGAGVGTRPEARLELLSLHTGDRAGLQPPLAPLRRGAGWLIVLASAAATLALPSKPV